MEYTTNKITTDCVTALGNAQATLDCVIKTDNKGGVGKLLSVAGEVTALTAQLDDNNAVMVCGALNIKMVCLDDEGALMNYDYVSDFKRTLDVKCTTAATLQVCAMILDIENHISGDCVKVKANAEFSIFAMSECEYDVIDSAGDCVIPRMDEIETTKLALTHNAQFAVVEEYECGVAIDKVLHFDSSVICSSSKLVQDGVMIMGEITSCVVYESDGVITTKQFNVPFSEEVAVMGEFDRVCASLKVEESKIILQGSGDDNIMRLEICIDANINLYQAVCYSVLSDACSCMCNVDMEYGEMCYSTFKAQLCLRDKINGSATLSEELMAIRRVLSTTVSRNCVTAIYPSNGMVTLEGILSANIIYEDTNADTNSVQIELPYSLPFDTDKICATDVISACANVEIINCKIKRDRDIDVTAMISANACVYAMNKARYVMAMTLSEGNMTVLPAITIYNSAPNESLWEIAKKIIAPIPAIIEQNPCLAGKQCSDGGKIIYYRHLGN